MHCTCATYYLPAGYNNIDIEAAKVRGVPVCTSPGYNAASVAEGAIMMMLMLVRRVHEQQVRPVLLLLLLLLLLFAPYKYPGTCNMLFTSLYTCILVGFTYLSAATQTLLGSLLSTPANCEVLDNELEGHLFIVVLML